MQSLKDHYSIKQWAYAWDKPSANGVIRELPENFKVTEQIKDTPQGTGEHVYLYIEKQNNNTDWLAGQLAKHSNVAKRDVGFAGMKDRRALTKQWFSVYLAAKAEPDWQALESKEIRILEVKRHQRKLRRGALKGNRFEILVSQYSGDKQETEARLQSITKHGAPNYFGEQRFGKDGKNIQRALDMFNGRRVKRNQRSIYLSSARSFIFNEILSQRIRQNSWRKIIAGDCVMLSGTNSVFSVEADKLIELQQRLDENDLHITGPLAGKGNTLVTAQAAELEQSIYKRYPKLVHGLVAADLEAARRSLVLMPQDMQWEVSENQLKLSFFLSAGGYATSVLREILDYSVAENNN